MTTTLGLRVAALALVVAAAGPVRAQTPAVEPPVVKVTPYGVVYFNGFYNSNATNNSDVPLWAVAGPGNTGASARQSRLGLRVSGAAAAGAKVSGVLEADFFGGFAAVGIGDNMGQLRLRIASARLEWAKTTLLVGQDWMVFAPANPVSLAAAGIPLMAASGNPWARLPQVRLERRAGVATFQGAVLAPSTGDFSSAFLMQPATGALGKRPFLQGRVAITSRSGLGTPRPVTAGVSGQYGRGRVITPASSRTVDANGVAFDLSLPVGSRVTLAGEAFAGQNLAGFQAGAFQGFNPDFAPQPGPRAIGTKGGWAQLGLAMRPDRLTVYLTYGRDDPDDADLVSASVRDWRVENESYAASVVHKVSAQLYWGLEFKHTSTRLRETGKRSNDHLNLGATFVF